MQEKEVHLYVDGSYSPKQGSGYGFVAVNSQNEIIHTAGEPIYESSYQKNTSVELIAAMRAVVWAEKKGFTILHIHHDYLGVHKATIEIPYPENFLHCLYHQFFATRFSSKKIQIQFHKVTAHSGNLFNDLADNLAKYGRNRNMRRAWEVLSSKHPDLHPSLSIFQFSSRRRKLAAA